MPELLNQNSCEHIFAQCCPCDSPAVYVASIIEVILLKSYLAQELHVYSFFPRLWSQPSLINDVKQYIPFQLCKHSFFHTSPDTDVHTIPRALVCLHLFASLKEEAEAAPISMGGVMQIQGHQITQNILQQTRKCEQRFYNPYHALSSPSGSLAISDWLEGTFSALQDLCHQAINVFS